MSINPTHFINCNDVTTPTPLVHGSYIEETKKVDIKVERKAVCKVCSSTVNLFRVYDFNKNCENLPMPKSFDINYYKCVKCDFIFTPDLDNIDFKKLIYNKDYPKFDPEFEVIRPRNNAQYVSSLIGKDISVLDYGGGTGKLAKLMRSQGYNVASYDPFYNDIRPKKKFTSLVSFEVLEHVPDPKLTLLDMLSFSTDIMLSTLVYEGPQDDWYISPRNGHISIYGYKTLNYLELQSASKLIHVSNK